MAQTHPICGEIGGNFGWIGHQNSLYNYYSETSSFCAQTQMEAKAGSYNKWYHHQNSMTSEFCKKYNVLEVQHLMSLTWSWDYSVSEPNGGAFKAKPVVNKIGENEMKARKSDPSSSQMRVGAPSNKSRLQIGARVLNFEASFHGSTCSPCLSSSATSLDKPLISKP